MTGINLDPMNPAGAPTPAEVRAAGFTWVRFVSHQGVADYAQACMGANLLVLAIVTAESGGYLCPADVYQIGNEPDLGTASDGPNSMTPAAYVDFWRLYRDTYPDLVMIGAGLASGNTLYWSAVKAAGGLPGASGFAAHPYGKTASQAKTLLLAYQKITPALPLWVTEWHRPAAEVPAFSAMLRSTAVASAFFCWSSGMVDGFGLSGGQQRALAATA